MADNNGVNFLISALIDNNSKNKIIGQLNSIQLELNKNPLKISIDENIVNILNKFANSMSKIGEASKAVNQVLNKQTTIVKELDGFTTNKTISKTLADGSILKEQQTTINKVKQAQMDLNRVKQIGIESDKQEIISTEKKIASYGRLIKSVKDLNLQGKAALTRNYFENAKGVKATTFTDINGNATRGARVTEIKDLTPSQQQVKNYKDAETASKKLLEVRKKIANLTDTDIKKLKALNDQETLYANRLQTITSGKQGSRKVMVDGKDIGALSKEGADKLAKLQKEQAYDLATVQSGIADELQKKQDEKYVKYHQQQSDLFVKTYNEQVKARQEMENATSSIGKKVNKDELESEQKLADARQKALLDEHNYNQNRIKNVNEFKEKSIKSIDDIIVKNKGLLSESSINTLNTSKNKISNIDANDIKNDIQQLKEYDKELDIVTKDIQGLITEQKRLNSLGRNSQDFKGNSSLLDKYNKINLQSHLESLSGTNSKILDLQHTFDNSGQHIIKYVEETKSANGTFEKFNRTIDVNTKTVRDNGAVTRNELTRNLSFMDQFKIAMERVPVKSGGIYWQQYNENLLNLYL